MMDGMRPAANDFSSTRLGSTICSWPTNSSKVRGRILSANGASSSAWAFLPCSNNDSDELMGVHLTAAGTDSLSHGQLLKVGHYFFGEQPHGTFDLRVGQHATNVEPAHKFLRFVPFFDLV